jgi:hypothetical protein
MLLSSDSGTPMTFLLESDPPMVFLSDSLTPVMFLSDSGTHLMFFLADMGTPMMLSIRPG